MKISRRDVITRNLLNGGTRVAACAAAGVPRRTFYNWIESDAAFREAVETAEAEAVAAVESAMYRCALKALEDPRYFRFMAFYLERRAGWVRPAPAKLMVHREMPAGESEKPGESVPFVPSPPEAASSVSNGSPPRANQPPEGTGRVSQPLMAVPGVPPAGDGASGLITPPPMKGLTHPAKHLKAM